MIDVYAAEGTFDDKHELAQNLAQAVMRWEQVPEIPLFADNTAAFVHDLPTEAIANAARASDHVRVQVADPGRSSRPRQAARGREGADRNRRRRGRRRELRRTNVGLDHRVA